MRGHRLLALAGLPFILGGAVGHTFLVERMAKNYAWAPSPWFQRQLASFELPHLYALALLLRGPGRIDDRVYVRMLSITSVLLGLHHILAIRRGDTAGVPNVVSASAATGLGLAGLALSHNQAPAS